MGSLRGRLIAWYVSVGAFVVAGIAVLAAAVTGEAASFEARQAMATAARQVPALIAQYRREGHSDLRGADAFLRRRFEPLRVIAHVRTGMQMPPRFGPRPGEPARRIPLFVRLLAMEIKPVSASFPGGEAMLFVDPARYQQIFAYFAAFVVLLAIVVLTAAWRIACAVAGASLEPLIRTTQALSRFGNGDFTPAPVRTDDRSEVGELAHAYNRAVEQITRAFAERSKAEAEMRQFVADAGHQLRTPLTVVMGYLSAMTHRAENARDQAALRTMLQQSRRMKALIDDLITLARLEDLAARNTRPVDLNDLCARLPEAFDDGAQTRLELRLPAHRLFAIADSADLFGALCALADNALKYGAGLPVSVALEAGGAFHRIHIDDCGPGMSEEDLRGGFDRFYRGSASEAAEGTGLGLSIARKAVERSGGTLTVENRAEGGLRCVISLPSCVAAADSVAS